MQIVRDSSCTPLWVFDHQIPSPLSLEQPVSHHPCPLCPNDRRIRYTLTRLRGLDLYIDVRIRGVGGERLVEHLVQWALKPTRVQLTELLVEECRLLQMDETWCVDVKPAFYGEVANGLRFLRLIMHLEASSRP